MIRKLIYFVAATALLAAPAAAQEGEGGPLLDLEYVLRAALGTNEQIEIAREGIEVARSWRSLARSALFPSTYFNGTLTRNDREQAIEFDIPGMEMPEDSPGGFVITPLYDWQASLTISQPLFVGFRDIRALQASGINIGLSEDQLDRTRRDLLFQVAAVYAEVVKAQRNLEISRQAVELARQQLRQAEVLLRAGEGIRTSVLQAEAQVAEAELGVIVDRSAMARAKEDLTVLTGIDGDYRLAPPGAPSLPAATLEELLAIGMEGRSELRAAGRQIAISELQIGIAAGEKLPTVSLDFLYNRQRSPFPSNAFWRLMLNFSVPIYDGGFSRARQAEAESAHRQAQLQRQLLERQIRAEIVQAHLDYESLRASRQTVQTQVELTRQAYADIERFHAVGEATDLELQDARQQFISAEKTLANISTDEVLALFSLRRSLGLLVVDIEEEPER